jgi:hypothetical protein
MSNTRVTQGHKVIIAGGGAAPAVISQGHKVILAGGGAAPAIVSQVHKVILFCPNNVEPETPRRQNFMSSVP